MTRASRTACSSRPVAGPPTAPPPRPACRGCTWPTSTTRCSTAWPAARAKETRVETEIENKFIPGPITVYNTVGEVRGSEKPDEIVVLGAHLDSWDLAQGTTDNGTGSCVVLESARVDRGAWRSKVMRPKRTIRFCLFTGEEQGLHGSRKYVERHKDELDLHSAALVHDTGTGKVFGFGMQERKSCLDVLEPELATLAELDGWTGLSLRRMGGTDHLPFNSAGVPGFACMQENDEYRLTHHTQSDTFDKAKEPNLIQGAQVMAVTAMRIANLPELSAAEVMPKDEPPPWGKAAAGEGCLWTGERTCVLTGPGEGGSLSRGRDSGEESVWPTRRRCRLAFLGVARLGGRFAVAIPTPIRGSLGGCLPRTRVSKAAVVPKADRVPAARAQSAI